LVIEIDAPQDAGKELEEENKEELENVTKYIREVVEEIYKGYDEEGGDSLWLRNSSSSFFS
jgi:hypothetical protein